MGDKPWLLVDEVPLIEGSAVELDPAESRHAAGPLRLKTGDLVVLADGSGRLAEALLATVSGRRCTANVTATVLEAARIPDGPTLALGVLHTQAMDWAVQKCVEIGVSTLIPVLTERSQLGAKAARGRLEHWRRVARQAIKQCRRPWFMPIADPLPFAALIAQRERRPGIVAAPDGRRHDELDDVAAEMVMVGPEGGFSADEMGQLDAAGWTRLRLGPYVLRADTAAVIAASIMVARFES
jgi:16S rRNA (uracil1498-N3)-methyltransferase